MGKPDRKRRRLCGGLALLLAGALPGGALAASLPATTPGKTTVGVQTVDMAPSSLSYTVPLYLTVAAAAGLPGSPPKVVTPEGYSLKNTTDSIQDGTYPGIVVSKVEVQGIADGTWSLRSAPASGQEISLSVGGLTLPDVDAGNVQFKEAAITANDNSFYDTATKKFLKIPGGPDAEALVLPVAGTLPDTFVPTDVKAAAQFRIKYTVSLLDSAGDPVGISYDGPSKEQIVNPSASAPTS